MLQVTLTLILDNIWWNISQFSSIV